MMQWASNRVRYFEVVGDHAEDGRITFVRVIEPGRIDEYAVNAINGDVNSVYGIRARD